VTLTTTALLPRGTELADMLVGVSPSMSEHAAPFGELERPMHAFQSRDGRAAAAVTSLGQGGKKMFYTWNWWWWTWVIPMAVILWLLFSGSSRRYGYGTNEGRYRYERERDLSRDRTRGAHRNRGPRNYRRSDLRITEDVCDLLMADDDVDASGMEVQVDRGEVTLSGNIPTRFEKRIAEQLAESVAGVTDVHNRLRIGKPDTNAPSQTVEAT
jgi:hypothetical protein